MIMAQRQIIPKRIPAPTNTAKRRQLRRLAPSSSSVFMSRQRTRLPIGRGVAKGIFLCLLLGMRLGGVIIPRLRLRSAMIARIPMRLLPPTQRPSGVRASFFGVGVDALVFVVVAAAAADEGRVVGRVIVGVVQLVGFVVVVVRVRGEGVVGYGYGGGGGGAGEGAVPAVVEEGVDSEGGGCGEEEARSEEIVLC